jgi:hypothetical protein
LSAPETVDDEMAMKVRRNRQAGPKHRADTGMFRLWRGLVQFRGQIAGLKIER